MNLVATDGKVIAYVLAFFIIGYIFNLTCSAYYDGTFYHESYEEMHYTQHDISMFRVRRYLKDTDWVDERVTNDELQYICQLAIHLSDYYDNIPPQLAIAIIAQESKFYRYDEYEGALGLMQLLPRFHRERLIKCIEEDERYSDELFYDPRLNIMVGLNYLSELIDDCAGDISYALMCYNQGPSSAYRTYVKGGIVSDYAENIMDLCTDLKLFLPTG